MAQKKAYHVAVVGATGAVGQKMLRVLEDEDFPVASMKLLASERSAGKKMIFQKEEHVVEKLTDEAFSGIDIAFFSAGGSISRRFAKKAVESGAVVIDNTSAFRMDPDVPLVVPEVNESDLDEHKGLIANPNCSTIQMVAALEPLKRAFGLRRIIVSTYQAVSGAGANAVKEMKEQTEAVLSGQDVEARVLPVKGDDKHFPIAFNAIPQIDTFEKNDYTFEEMKMINETRKIMHDPSLPVAATCVRLPIETGHAESVYIELKHPASVKELRQTIQEAPGVVLQDDPSEQLYPMPLMAAGKKEVFVGRIRRDLDVETGFHLWIVSDNLLKGAAWNSVQIAQRLLARNLL